MAYGAHLAAAEAGRAGGIAFIGIDGIPAEGVRWVADGILDATFLYERPGDEGLRQALRWLRDELPPGPLPRRLLLPTQTIDADAAAALLAGDD
jgi:ribose transport system substrate-binding protein